MKTKMQRKALRSVGAFLLKLSAISGRGNVIRQAQVSADKRIAQKLESWVGSKGFLDDCTLDEVAARIGVEPQQLSYYCSNILGEPFVRWRKNLRLLEARDIIRRDPDVPLALVGRMVGIPDKSNFRKLFRQSFGMSPKEWRDGCREEYYD